MVKPDKTIGLFQLGFNVFSLIPWKNPFLLTLLSLSRGLISWHNWNDPPLNPVDASTSYFSLQPWRWGQHVRPKCWYTSKRLHDATTWMITIYTLNTVKNSRSNLFSDYYVNSSDYLATNFGVTNEGILLHSCRSKMFWSPIFLPENLDISWEYKWFNNALIPHLLILVHLRTEFLELLPSLPLSLTHLDPLYCCL